MSTWEDLKQQGSEHYKTGTVEPIDLYRALEPHPNYNAFAIFALTNAIKYAARLLTRGYYSRDVDKIMHYIALYRADQEEKQC